jgi:Arc/MetJ-type ribon-helix-helix transcriptional regulator
MKTFTVQLPTELADYVQELLDQKVFASIDAVMASGICCLENAMALDDGNSDELRAEILKGVEQLDRGESIDGPSFMNGLLARARARTRASA